MPANRNDITHKPIMTTAPDKPRWRLYDQFGKVRIIWADTLEEAMAHATEIGLDNYTIKKGD